MRAMQLVRVFVAIVFVFGARSSQGTEPGDGVKFTYYESVRQQGYPNFGEVLSDIMSHEAPGDQNYYDDRITLAHETSHGIHAYLRNYLNTTGKHANGFYVLKDRAVIVVEPNIRKSSIAHFVPRSLQASRFSTYVTGQTEWDDTPLYLWDEWTAYINGGETGVDLVQRNLWSGPWQDAMMGQLEFVVYAIATAMAVKEQDPDYFNEYKQFREFLAFNIRRSMQSYKVGSLMTQFRWDRQDRYFSDLKTKPDAASLRSFTKNLFGAAWAKKYLGF